MSQSTASPEPNVAVLRARLLEKMGQCAHAYPEHIEKQFPRILAELARHWGTSRMEEYLNGLMLSDRPDRQGFPAEVIHELFALGQEHDKFGLWNKQATTGWESADDPELHKRHLNS